jgi:hypothetical protein
MCTLQTNPPATPRERPRNQTPNSTDVEEQIRRRKKGTGIYWKKKGTNGGRPESNPQTRRKKGGIKISHLEIIWGRGYGSRLTTTGEDDGGNENRGAMAKSPIPPNGRDLPEKRQQTTARPGQSHKTWIHSMEGGAEPLSPPISGRTHQWRRKEEERRESRTRNSGKR